MYRKPRNITVAIANGGTTSSAIKLGDYVIGGIIIPSVITSSVITFTAAEKEGGTYMPVYDSDNNVVSVGIGASRACGMSGAEADALAPWDWIKIVCGSSEGAARTLYLLLK